jgi:hypothetical protein
VTRPPIYTQVRDELQLGDVPDPAQGTEHPVVASQNGWIAGATDRLNTAATAEGTLVRFPGGVRADAPGQLLMAVAGRFHREVEPLVDGQCWGYAYRPIRGATTISNHASGTAIDCNAPRHQLGTDPAASFSGAQIDAIHRILAAAGGVVRWGGTYTGRKDPMHFEITDGADLDDCQRALDALRARPAPAAPTTSTLQKGSTGEAVKRLQQVLNAWYPDQPQLVVDGVFGPATEAMVRYLQANAGLAVDGIAGPKTLAVLRLA